MNSLLRSKSPRISWRQWLKTSSNPSAKFIYKYLVTLRGFEIPAPKWIWLPPRKIWSLLTNTSSSLIRILWWTPLFKSYCQHMGKGLYLYGGLPWIAGPIHLSIGDNCRISGHTTFTGRSAASARPQLILGNNIDIGWQTTIAVGTRICIGNNVRIAGQCFLAGYPGHPTNPADRANHLPELDHQAKDIVLSDNVWLGTGVKVLAGVHIGKNTIVGTGSVVTHNLPDNVIAAGNPAKIIRSLEV